MEGSGQDDKRSGNQALYEREEKTYQGRLPNVLAVSPSCHMCSDWPLYLRAG